MKLSKILIGIKHQKFGNDVAVTSIHDDSRKVIKGSLFVAIKGLTYDAHDYIDDVISKGARVVCGEIAPRPEWLKRITYIQVANTRDALGYLASNWFNNPSSKLKIIGVTGTDGKTTTANILYHILTTANKKVGLISTISAKFSGEELDTGFHVTNPEPLALQEFLHKMVEENIEYVVLEVTSHGLKQGRVNGVNFDYGVLTNITEEHLDYHKTFEDYRESKGILFTRAKILILNADDPSAGYFIEKNKSKKILTYALKNKADIKAEHIVSDNESTFEIIYNGKRLKIYIPLIGEYNVLNALAGISLASFLRIKSHEVVSALATLPGIAGRMQEIANDKGFRTIVDFAHTPNSLEIILNTLKKQTAHKLIVIFGCASERDVNKRPKMARIATTFADVSIFTAEDPRKENIECIFDDMEKGVEKAHKIIPEKFVVSEFKNENHVYIRIPERGDAIYFAIQKIAQKGDIIVVCGKGHEKSMSYNGVEYPWDDVEAVKMALKGKTMTVKR